MDAKSKRKVLSLLDEDNIGNQKIDDEQLNEKFLGFPTNHDDVEEMIVKMINTSPKVRKVLENIINNVLSKSIIKVSLRDSFKED